MQVKKLDMEQQTGSKSGKYQIKAVYCDNMVTILSQYMVTIYRVTNVQSTFHMMYSDHMQSTSCEMPGWMKHKLESRLLGEISITSDMQMTLMAKK